MANTMVKAEELLEGLAEQTANYAKAIITADNYTKKVTAIAAYVAFLQSLITSVILADAYGTIRDR